MSEFNHFGHATELDELNTPYSSILTLVYAHKFTNL
jgi:hypothetical protein